MLTTLKELLDKRAFKVASDEEVLKISDALDSLRPEASQEILQLLSPPVQSLQQAQPAEPAPARHPNKIITCLILIFLLGIGIYYFYPVQKPIEMKSQTLFQPLSRAELNQRISRAISATQTNRVIYEDILGEGLGAWDSSPRYPSGIVNCILWIDLILSETYGAGLADKIPVMDKIRYYGGQTAFGLRKHFLLHRLNTEPQPLKPVFLSQFKNLFTHERVTHNFNHFGAEHKYTCPFYKMNQNSFVLDYLSPVNTLKATRDLPAGFYFLFGVPTDYYQKIFGGKSGPMGLVHGIILEIGSQGPIVYHASTSAKKIVREPLDQYINEMKRSLHKGYVIYEADPTWNFTLTEPADPEALTIQKCENELYLRGGRRSAGLR